MAKAKDNAEPRMRKQDKIVIIDDIVEAVRTTPDVYIGSLGNTGFLSMIREVLQNSLDEISKGNSIDKRVIVSYDAITHTVIIEDFGQGIPIDILDKVFSNLHSSSNYHKAEGSGIFSSGKNGCGSKITNFLSRFFIVESRRMDGTGARVEFEEGKLNSKGVQTFQVTDGRHGLFTTFAPTAMVGEITVTPQEVGNLIWEQCHFYPVGTSITYNSIGLDGSKHRDVIENKNGLIEILNSLCIKPLITPIAFNADDGSHAVDCLITWDAANMNDPAIIASVNMCHTTTYGSTHVDGLDEALTKFFRNYMNKTYLANSKAKNKLNVTAQDVRTGLRCVICGKSITPLYTGQSKEVYSELEMKPYVQNVAYDAISNWAKNNPGGLQSVCKYLKDVCELRTSVDTQRVKIQNNYTASVISGLPAKYKKPNVSLKELWINSVVPLSW